MYNQVETIESKAEKIKKLVPEAKVEFAHGQMTGSDLEEIMERFVRGDINVLVCTTILESGIDIPNANTIIVENADRLGLAQLYQIRGRVGRSDSQAYAYITYKRSKSLSEVADKRLKAIKEFTELGSGFNIAMRDLSIRGAGDILGSEQAGFIDSVGYDLYVKILNDEVARLKGLEVKEEEQEDEKPIVNVTTHIDDKYTDSDSLKIEIHKLINEIDSKETLERVKQEIEDRFGKINDDIDVYMHSELLEKLAKKLEVNNITANNLYVEFILNKDIINDIDITDLFVYASKLSTKYRFNYKNDRLYIKLLLSGLEKHYVYYLVELFEHIIKIKE